MIEGISTKIVEYLTTVSHALWWIGSIHHILILIVLALYVFLKKRGRTAHWLISAQIVLLCSTVSYAAFRNANLFNGVVFSSLALFWISEIALGRMAPIWEKVSKTRTILSIFVALWGYYYPHFIEIPYLTGIWRSPTGLVPCPTLMLILAWCVFAVPEYNHVVYWIMISVGLFYGFVGVFMLHIWQDLPLIFIAIYGLLIPLLPQQASIEQERATMDDTKLKRENETQ